MSTPYGDDPLHTVNAHAVAEDMTQATDGALTITVHSGGSLIRHARIKPAVDNGRVPIGEVLMSQRGNVDALFEVDAIPFLATDYGQAHQLWAATSRPASRRRACSCSMRYPGPPGDLCGPEIADDPGSGRTEVPDLPRHHGAGGRGALMQVELTDIPAAFARGTVEAMITTPSSGGST